MTDRRRVVIVGAGFGGLEAAKRILATYPACIILMTGYSDAEFEQQAEAAGVHGFVVKPLATEALPTILARAFHVFCQVPSTPESPAPQNG